MESNGLGIFIWHDTRHDTRHDMKIICNLRDDDVRKTLNSLQKDVGSPPTDVLWVNWI